MGRAGALVLGLVLLRVWGSARARPEVAAVSEAAPVLLDKDAILDGCPVAPPTAFATPQQLAGDWCGLQNPGGNASRPSEICDRYTFYPDGDPVWLASTMTRDGQKYAFNVTFNKQDNGSWLNVGGGRARNFFIGVCAEGRLHMCGTIGDASKRPERVVGTQVERCPPAPDAARAHCSASAPTPL